MLIAVDTNVLLDQAIEDEDVLDAFETLRKKLPKARFWVTPTVLAELAHLMDHGDAPERAAALTALQCLLSWKYEPVNVIAVGMGIAETISFKLRASGIVPEEEQNDAAIIAEAALLGCTILLSSDGHLVDAGRHPQFHSLLKDCSVDGDELVIARPRDIVNRFYQKK